MAKIHVDDLLVLNRPQLDDDGNTGYRIRSYTGQDYKDSVQEVIDDNKLDDRYVNMTGDTMSGLLTIDLGVDPLDEENVESLTVYGRTTQTQVVISPIVVSDELAHPSLIFSSADPLYNRKRNHEVLMDTTVTFRKYEGEFENASDILTLAGTYVFSPVPLRVGTEIGTSEALINPDGTSVFESVVIRQTNPTLMSEDNLIHKAYVDEKLENVQEELTALVTVEKEEVYRYLNGNVVSFVNPVTYNWVSIQDVGSVLRVALDPDATVPVYNYVNGTTYDTTTSGIGQGLTVIVSEVSGTVVGISVNNPGSGYTTADDVSLTLGGLEVDIKSVSSGVPFNSEEGLTAVSEGQFRWELGSGATDETWGEIETLYLSLTDNDSVVQDVDEIFPTGHFIDIGVNGLESDEYYGRYEIVSSRVGPSLEVTGLSVASDDQVGVGYTPVEGALTTTITGSGEGLTVDVTAVDLDTGAITEYIVRTPGSGYAVGDTVELEGGVVPAIITISSIQDTLSVDKQNLIIIEVSYTGSNFGDEDNPLPDPAGTTAYEIKVQRRILNEPSINGYFNWFYSPGTENTFENITTLRYAAVDRDNIIRNNLDFPVGSIIILNDTTEEETLYAQYRIVSSTLEEFSIEDPVVEGALITYEYIDIGVENTSIESEITPPIVSGTEFNSTVVVSSPILDEMELETQRVNNKFGTIDDSLVNIREDLEALENSITSGSQRYQTPLTNLATPGAGKFYFYKQDNVATPFFNEPGEEVAGVYLTAFDATTGAGRDWVIGLQPNESVLIVSNLTDDTNATYLIETFDTILEGNTDEVSYYDLKLQFISGTPHPSTSTTADVINFKTRLLNDGISRQEAEESYVSVLGDFIRGDLSFRDDQNDINVVDIQPQEKIIRVGRTNSDTGFKFKSYGNNLECVHNDVVYERRTSTFTSRYLPLAFDGANRNYISGLDTDMEETDLSYAANLEYVQTYVQEYVGDIVGVITPASKTRLGPVKLDKAGILSQDGDNQLVVRRANTNVPGVASFTSSHFGVTTLTDDDGNSYTQIKAKTITSNSTSSSGYGMVQIDNSTVKVNNSHRIYVPSASAGTKGVMKIKNHNSTTQAPNWSEEADKSIAASAKAVYHAHTRAEAAYSRGFSGGQALHSNSSSSVGGIRKSGSTYYLRIN